MIVTEERRINTNGNFESHLATAAKGTIELLPAPTDAPGYQYEGKLTLPDGTTLNVDLGHRSGTTETVNKSDSARLLIAFLNLVCGK